MFALFKILLKVCKMWAQTASFVDISYWCFSTKTSWNLCATSRSNKKAYIQTHFSNFRWILQIFILFMLFANVL